MHLLRFLFISLLLLISCACISTKLYAHIPKPKAPQESDLDLRESSRNWMFLNDTILKIGGHLRFNFGALAKFQFLRCFGSIFQFADDPIDVVIPCVEKDLVTLNHCISGIRENGVNIRRIIVVSKNKLTDQAEWFSEEHYPFSISDVSVALANGNLDYQEALLQKQSRAGWYYQQLLKLYALLIIPDISSNVLILDSDTIFLNPVTFLNEHHAGMYNPGKEYCSPYFVHAALLIPGFYKCFTEYSGISHHMIFQRSVIEDLFSTVEQAHSVSFWEAFCHCVDPQALFYSGAADYEIYFNYVFSRTNQTSIRKLKWRNIRKLKDLGSYQRKGYHFVSFHSYNRIVN